MKAPKPVNVDDYITGFPEDVQKVLQEIRKIVHDTGPGVLETIKYDMPTYMLENENMFHFAAFKNHIGLYPVPDGDKDFDEEISSYKTGKGSVRIPLNEPIPMDLITRIVHFNAIRITNKIKVR